MDQLIERLRTLVETNCREILDEDHLLCVDAVGGSENVVFEVHCDKADIGLIIGKNGCNIEALRTVVLAARRGVKIRTTVEVLNSRR